MTAELERFLRRRCGHLRTVVGSQEFSVWVLLRIRCMDCEKVVDVTHAQMADFQSESELRRYVKNKLGSGEAADVRRLGLSVPSILPTLHGERHGAAQ